MQISIQEKYGNACTSFNITIKVTPFIPDGIQVNEVPVGIFAAMFTGWHQTPSLFWSLKSSAYPNSSVCNGYNTDSGLQVHCPPISFSSGSITLLV
jgi:hypothetical protein